MNRADPINVALIDHVVLRANDLERLKLNTTGDIVLRLKSPYQDDTTHIVMTPLQFMQHLAALVPRPKLNLIRFHGLPSA